MLAGAALPMKFWPYAFQHFLHIYNVTVHGDQDASPSELCSGSRPNLSLLRVFGCRVYALPARPRRPDKLVSDACIGIFLGYAKTLKNVVYFDTVTETVKTAQHVAFDEAMHDLPEKPPPMLVSLLHLLTMLLILLILPRIFLTSTLHFTPSLSLCLSNVLSISLPPSLWVSLSPIALVFIAPSLMVSIALVPLLPYRLFVVAFLVPMLSP
jgi:hypothetical protein